MKEALTEKEETVPDCESIGQEHEWEAMEYDPTVGLMSRGRVCVVCEKTEAVDDSGDFNDNYF